VKHRESESEGRSEKESWVGVLNLYPWQYYVRIGSRLCIPVGRVGLEIRASTGWARRGGCVATGPAHQTQPVLPFAHHGRQVLPHLAPGHVTAIVQQQRHVGPAHGNLGTRAASNGREGAEGAVEKDTSVADLRRILQKLKRRPHEVHLEALGCGTWRTGFVHPGMLTGVGRVPWRLREVGTGCRAVRVHGVPALRRMRAESTELPPSAPWAGAPCRGTSPQVLVPAQAGPER
jgi:hypothetical protein